ncbi:Uncharacterized protein DAT39_005757 [Clarias magur]|uniref:Uncharacterized protein n=1 Tax=Clarias magur TaxID=1594786 RepID=A0A8J4X7D3_CLAMG|nr:Uncharacterized protein DAT39_005757 [Clarias magur]
MANTETETFPLAKKAKHTKCRCRKMLIALRAVNRAETRVAFIISLQQNPASSAFAD